MEDIVNLFRKGFMISRSESESQDKGGDGGGFHDGGTVARLSTEESSR